AAWATARRRGAPGVRSQRDRWSNGGGWAWSPTVHGTRRRRTHELLRGVRDARTGTGRTRGRAGAAAAGIRRALVRTLPRRAAAAARAAGRPRRRHPCQGGGRQGPPARPRLRGEAVADPGAAARRRGAGEGGAAAGDRRFAAPGRRAGGGRRRRHAGLTSRRPGFPGLPGPVHLGESGGPTAAPQNATADLASCDRWVYKC